MADLKKLGEFGLIHRLRSHLKYKSPRLKLGIGDDCAVYSTKTGTYEIASTDALVESVHFDLKFTSPRLLGRKSLAVNISDIAAMGGVPRLAFIAIGIPDSLSIKFLDDFYKGINQICMEHKIELAGGDTVASPKHLFLNITIIGEVTKNKLMTRSGAQPGDAIFVTGTPGESALGLKLLTNKRRQWKGSERLKKQVIRSHLDPVPRLKESQLLAKSKARITSMIDVSDGLVQDLFHICDAGNVGAVLKQEWLPESPALCRLTSLNTLNSMDFILSGGEDYELLFTLKNEDARKLSRQFEHAKTPVTRIGEITSQPGKVVLQKENGKMQPLRKNMGGFNHFRPRTR